MKQSITQIFGDHRILGPFSLLIMVIAAIAAVALVAAFQVGATSNTWNPSNTATLGSHGSITTGPNGDAAFKASATSRTLTQPVPLGVTFTVNSAGDANDVSLDGICDSDAGMVGNQCTLRAAVQEANNISGTDTIEFDPLLNGGAITLGSALPSLKSTTINGPGPNLLTVQAASTNITVFSARNEVNNTLTISGLTIANGFNGIEYSGVLLLNNCAVIGNSQAGVDAHGIATSGPNATINNSTISNNGESGIRNTSPYWRAYLTVNDSTITNNVRYGILTQSTMATATATINNSTISGNSLGGIRNFAGPESADAILDVNNCTISGNNGPGITTGFSSDHAVGSTRATINNSTISGNVLGITFSHTGSTTPGPAVTLNNSTVTNNSSGGLALSHNVPISFTLRNTIVAGNTAGNSLDINGAVDPASSFNLIGNGTGMTAGPSNGSNGNQIGTSATPINPLLGPLANNGGPTLTHALVSPGSPALDAGDNANATNAGLTTDQRGLSRIVDGPDADTTATVDIGAFESSSGAFIDDIADRSMTQDTSVSFNFNAGGGPTGVSVTASSSNTALVPNSPANLQVIGVQHRVEHTLVITPAAGQVGTTTITVTVTVPGGSAFDTFILTVNPNNTPPSFTKGPDQTVPEDSGPRTIPNWATNISPGPGNESGQTLTFLVQNNTNPSLFSSGPAISPTGTLTYTPAANANGSATITIALMDNGGGTDTSASQTFVITVTGVNDPVNDPPVAVSDELADVAEDSGPRTIPFGPLTANDSTGPANESGQTLVVKTVGNAVGGQVSIVGSNVVFTPTANYFGGASFDYTVEDNGTTNGAADPRTSGPATARFTVTAVNDAPTAVNDTLSSVAEDSGERTILASALTGNDLVGPANEVGETLVFKTVSNAVGGTVSIVGGNVHFTPTADFNGLASFQYTVEDNGTTSGVANPKTSGAATASFNISAVADTPSVTNATTNANTQTTSGLVISRNPADGAEVTHFKITGITGGTLFKNDGVTPINNGNFITFAEGNAGLKFTPGTSNGSFQVQASTSALDAGLQGGIATATITVNPGGGVIRFSSGTYSVAEGAGFITITVERTGDTSQAVTVDYASSDHSNPPDFIPCTSPGAGFASSRCDFTTAIGRLRFAAGETSKTFNVLISDDNYVEGPESLNLTLSNPTGGAVFGVPSTAILNIIDDVSEPATNPIDTAGEFVSQQYHDMLNREPDAGGLAFWTDNIEKCNDPARRPAGQTAAVCIDKQRESTAMAFFMSPEFQMTGGFAYHLNKGSLTGPPNYDGGSAGRFPSFLEFMSDMSQVSEGIVVNGQISGAVVEANRNRLAAEFVQRPEFVAKYGGLDNTLYVQELFNTTGIAATAAEKQALVDGLTGGTETRASVLRKVVDGTVVISEGNVQFTTTYGQAFINQENRRLFVYLEYIGYLRRNPDTAGFVFWLGKLNFFNGDPFQAEMVRAFILSPEYRSRFGQQ